MDGETLSGGGPAAAGGLRARRLYGTGAVLAAATALACLALEPRAALGALLGGGTSLLGFRWLQATLDRALAGRPTRRAVLSLGSFLLRLLFWGVAAWGAVRLGRPAAAGFLAGTTAVLAAVFLEGIRGGSEG